MPRRRGNQKKVLSQHRNVDGQFTKSSEICMLVAESCLHDRVQQREEGDDVDEEVDAIDDIDCRERGWHSEQDDNGSELDDTSCDEFDEESVISEGHDFSEDTEFYEAMSTAAAASDEEQSDSGHQESLTQPLSDPAKFLSWTRDADKGPIANKMPRGSSRSTIWRHKSKVEEEDQRVKRIRHDATFAKSMMGFGKIRIW